jgi:hypothetical protein
VSASRALSVIPARLPYLDRRALSEAWYAALHRTGTQRRELSARRGTVAERPFAAHVRVARRAATAAANRRAPAALRASLAALQRPALAAGDAVRARTVEPRVARRAPAGGAAPPLHAQITLTLDGARVRIIARRDGARTQVIALCSAAHLETVRRALGMLECALRARGERLEAAIRTLPAAQGEGQHA